MDSTDRPEPNLPAVPLRFTTSRPALFDPMSAAPGAPGSDPALQVNVLRAAFRAVTRHWWQILLLWAAATGGLTYLIMLKVQPIYESVSMLKVEATSQDLFQVGMRANEGFLPFMETQVQLVQSPIVLSAALADPKVAAQPSLQKTPDPEAELRSLIMVTVMPNTYLLRVAMTSPSSTECATIVNAVVKAYLNAASEWADGMTRKQIKSLEGYLRDLTGQLEAKEAEWLELAGKTNAEMAFDPAAAGSAGGALPVAQRNRVTLDEYKRVRDALFQVNVELTQAEALLGMREEEYARAAERARPPEGGDAGPQLPRQVDAALRSDPDLRQIAQEIGKAEAKYAEAGRRTRNGSDPSVVATRKRVIELRAEYADLAALKRDEIVARLQNPEALAENAVPKEVREARETVARLRATKTSYQEMISKIEVTNKQEGSDQVKVALVREAHSSISEMQKAVEKRLEQLRFESRGEARVTKVNDARATGIPLSDNRKKYLIAAPLAVLGLVVGLFVMLEVKIGRVSDMDDFSRSVPTEVFALPPLPGPRLEPGQRGAREREARLLEFLQSLDHLRVALCETPAATGTGRCLIVTSATEAEGKTTLSAQLAACCAKAGVSTLLVDADMRRATLSRMLNEEKTPGLSDMLQGDLAPDDAAVAVADAGFHLVPAGSSGRDPSWLLKGQGVGKILTRYRQLFDLIIIDTPPVLPVPDALTLGRWADGALLATRFDVSRIALVLKARHRMHSAGIPVLKTVVNGVKTSRFYHGYGYGGNYFGYGSYGGYSAYDSRTSAAPEQPTTTTA